MAAASDQLFILHFNDVYNIEPRNVEPCGGAARFKTLVDEHRHLAPLVFFSGDAFNPSTISGIMKGEQMLPVLNAIGIDAAVYGNHDFDFGVDALEDLAAKCNFPWLMSNVFDRGSAETLGKGKLKLLVEHGGRKVGVVGLVEEDWITTLSTIENSETLFVDYVTQGEKLAAELRDEGADYVIALTHMRWPNDTRLAEECRGIDLFLGGHDHDWIAREVNGKWIIKSGSDFCQMSLITLTFRADGKADVAAERLEVTSALAEDPQLREVVAQYEEIVIGKMEQVVGHVGVELDGRFSSLRSRETNLGNLVCDIMLAAFYADCALLNSGGLRSDMIHPVGELRLKDVKKIISLSDPILVILCSGKTLLAALENGVAKHPYMEGRFPQVAGIRFAFDSRRPPRNRIDPCWVFVQDEPLDLNREYKVCIRAYMAHGKDGYSMFVGCPMVVDEEQGPLLENIVLNHFQSIAIILGNITARSRHRQNVVSLARLAALASRLSISSEELSDNVSTPTSDEDSYFGHQKNSNIATYFDIVSQWEAQSCLVAPQVEGRIREIRTNEELHEVERERHDLGSLQDVAKRGAKKTKKT